MPFGVKSMAVFGSVARGESQPESDIDIKWAKIAGLRDIVAHEYFGLDIDILWDIVQHHVPDLPDNIQEVMLQKDLSAGSEKGTP
jgi:uncharacterized protein with HEPN domain